MSTIPEGFANYLTEILRSNKDSKYIYSLANEYGHILIDGKASELLNLQSHKRRQVMRSLSHLARYSGLYNNWLDIKQNHHLQWTVNNYELRIFEEPDITQMFHYLKRLELILPSRYFNVFKFACLTGLRASEVFYAISLIKSDCENYYNKKREVLEHYKFPEIFLRKTKKAYLSIVIPQIIELAHSCEGNYNSIDHMLRRRKIPTKFGYCRKIFATYLSKTGIEREFIDLLQGRTHQSVFSRHYFRPNFNHQRIRDSLTSLYDSIISRMNIEKNGLRFGKKSSKPFFRKENQKV